MTTTGLQCPSCGHVHPLAEVAGQGQFRCQGCNRLLSVPESVAPPPPARDGEATRAHPAAAPSRAPQGGRPGPVSPPGAAVLPSPAIRVPAALRVSVWVLALIVGFLASAALLRVVGLLDVDTVLDTFAGEGVRRYAVLLVLLPLWAVLAAGAAHLVLEWLAGRRERKAKAKSRRREAGPENPQPRKGEGARRAV